MARILVVEDNEQLSKNITEQLEMNQHEVRVAGNGQEALDLLPSFSPDLILSDVMMPVMNGIDFIRALKRNSAYRSIPFIFLTAKVTQQDKFQGLEEGAIDYLPKPFLQRELLLKVNNITRLRSEFIIHSLHHDPEDESDFHFVRKFTNLLEEHFNDSSMTANKMAEAMNMSLSAFQRAIRSYFQQNFSDILKDYRLQKATKYLAQTDQSIQLIAEQCGFSSLSYFSFSFKKLYKLSPLRFRIQSRSKPFPASS